MSLEGYRGHAATVATPDRCGHPLNVSMPRRQCTCGSNKGRRSSNNCLYRRGCRSALDCVSVHGYDESLISEPCHVCFGLKAVVRCSHWDVRFGSKAEVGDRAGSVGSWRTSGRNSTQSGHSMMARLIRSRSRGCPSATPRFVSLPDGGRESPKVRMPPYDSENGERGYGPLRVTTREYGA